MSSTQGKKMVLVAWIPLSILLLVWATSYSGSEVSGELSSKSFFHCSDNCNAHGRSTVVNGQCGCICSKGWAGKDCSISDGKEISKAVEEDEGRVKDVGIQHVRSAEEHMGIHDDSDHKVSDHTEHKHEELTEAEKVLRDYPSLQYATEGEEACQKANEVWKERVKTAYGNSQEEIQGKEGLHLYFTTDCTKHSLWQALTLEHSWAKIKQPGALTRIVSGCFKSNGEAHPNTELMKRRTIPHSKFFVFFGPKVGGRQPSRGVVKCDASVAGWYEGAIIKEEKSEGLDDCKHRCRETAGCHYYNFRHGDKACHLFSARGAFHNAEDHSTGACVGGSDTTADAYKLPDYLADYPPINRPATAMYWLNYAKPLERVLGLLDPDMIFARPMLFHYVGNQVVEKGKPVGQFYDYLVSQDWDKHYTAICNEPHVCKPLGNKKDFAPGPPHLMHRKDWFEVAPWWLRYTIGARRLWRAWTSEMAGMSIGLARLGLRSRLVEDGMWDRTTAAANMLKGLDLYFGDMDSWKTCGNENAECDIPDDAEYEVRYGPSPDANFVEKRARGQKLHCSHQTNDLGTGYFTGNDPAPGQAKMCFYRNPAKAIDKKGTNKVFESTEESKWSYCTEEGGTCILPTTSTFSVRFGASSTAEFTEKTGVKGGSHVQCIEQAGAELAFDNDPASGKSKQCFFKQETGKFPPPALQQYISSDKLPSLFHYCFTLEVNRGGWPEKLWRYAAPQRKWEEENGKPLMGYIHWSKYRSLTDWPRRDDAHTILECDQPMLFQFPPLPHMLKNWSKNSEDKGWHVFFAIISPAVNDAMVQYKLQYCPDPSKINYERRVRTGHDQHWISYFETVMDPSAAEGFSFTSHL